jgi:methionyl-tRNA formyltransferase
VNIIFMGTPDFAVPSLVKLHEQGYNIDLVVTQKDKPRGRGKKIQYPPIKQKALEFGLEVYQPDSVNNEESIAKFRELKPDVIVVVAFGQILKKKLLEIPKYDCINVHASLLPKYRGAAPINWAIINGESETGITIMQIEEGLDSGDIILSQSISITPKDDFESLHDKLSVLGGELLIKALEEIKIGKDNRVPQDDNLSSYAPMISKSTGKIDWNKSGKDIYNLVMGLRPTPSAYTIYNDLIMKIHKVSLKPKMDNEEIGKVIKVNREGIFVNSKDNCVVIEEIQFPGKKRMSVKDYLAGNKIEEGIIFNS